MRSCIILALVVMGLCFCGLLIAQDQPSGAPAATSDVVTTEEGGGSGATTATAVGTVKPGSDTTAPSSGVVPSEEKAPKKEGAMKAPVKPVTE
ncbi:MAG: hypothetical protein NTZ78_06325 [Candidatus Aureabacteria bacterium]|nr:hypothetical protein [Candidatus Auribacterota bacterium]